MLTRLIIKQIGWDKVMKSLQYGYEYIVSALEMKEGAEGEDHRFRL